MASPSLRERQRWASYDSTPTSRSRSGPYLPNTRSRSRVSGDRKRHTELATRAGELTHDQMRGAVERLGRDQDLAVEPALEPPPPALNQEGPLSFQQQLATLADLCRQLLRLFDNIRRGLSPDERRGVQAVLADLRRAIAGFAQEATG